MNDGWLLIPDPAPREAVIPAKEKNVRRQEKAKGLEVNVRAAKKSQKKKKK